MAGYTCGASDGVWLQKLHGFLFEKVMVLTRPASRAGQLRYQVYRQPLILDRLALEDVKDGQKMGSFKSTFSQNTATSECGHEWPGCGYLRGIALIHVHRVHAVCVLRWLSLIIERSGVTSRSVLIYMPFSDDLIDFVQ